MKAALITEEQIKAIQDALEIGIDFANDEVAENTRRWGDRLLIKQQEAVDDRYEIINALAIVKSLKVQEPVAYGHWTSPAWSEEPVSLNTSVEKPSGFRTESANWFPLYAGEQP